MNIVDQFIPLGHPNRPGIALTPYGITFHRTGADHGSIWLGGYFAREPRQAIIDNNTYGSSHVGIGDEGIRRYIPEDEVAWHVAGDAHPADTAHVSQNYRRIGVELCQYLQVPPRITPKTYALTVAFSADLCKRKGWAGPREVAPDGLPRFTRHSDHQSNRPGDPGEYLRWDDLLNDVERAIAGAAWKYGKAGATVEQALLEVVGAIKGLSRTVMLVAIRLQRGLDVERTNTKYDPNVKPIDPAV